MWWRREGGRRQNYVPIKRRGSPRAHKKVGGRRKGEGREWCFAEFPPRRNETPKKFIVAFEKMSKKKGVKVGIKQAYLFFKTFFEESLSFFSQISLPQFLPLPLLEKEKGFERGEPESTKP